MSKSKKKALIQVKTQYQNQLKEMEKIKCLAEQKMQTEKEHLIEEQICELQNLVNKFRNKSKFNKKTPFDNVVQDSIKKDTPEKMNHEEAIYNPNFNINLMMKMFKTSKG